MSNDTELNQTNDSSVENTEEVVMTPAQALESLKLRADRMGLKYHPSISFEKLSEKIAAALADENKGDKDVDPVAPQPAPVQAPKEETANEKRARLKKEAFALVRIRVTCMNPAKREWEGELFTAGNSLVGSVTKYVPFNNDEGWHVPRIILNQIQNRQCQIFTTVRDSQGRSSRKGKMIKEFAVEILDPLTPEELAELARRQAATKAVD